MPLSSQVEEYQRVIEPIIALLTEPARAAKTIETLKQRYAAYLQTGEVMPDVGFLLILLSRELAGSQQGVKAADQAYALEESDDPAVKQAVEDATTALYNGVVQLRGEINAVYGEGAINALGMQGETTRVPVRLARHARTIVERLLDDKISLGKSLSTRLRLDRKEVAEALSLLCDALEVQLAALIREKAELLQKQDERNRALALWEETVPSNCAAARGLLLLAVDVEGASRVASTPKRRVSSTGDEDAPTEDSTDPKPKE
jgi:hypothetical protein